ncbi:MAG: 12-oxophytodienoate reductase [Bacteroidetes bacterium]|nr:12-oxophytodienoate reductase [Bacteroidota bacterium]
MKKILTPYTKGNLTLKNHLVMAPMTRSRAIGNLPNDLIAEYYGQRSGAGLIITEGVSPLPEGLGYTNIPGIFSAAQTEGWKKTAAAVHSGNGKIFMQLMHTGRIGHNLNLPAGSTLVGASSLKATGQIYTHASGVQDYSGPVALTTEGVKKVIEGYGTAAKNAVEAGFDGVELHAANGYLPEQFLNPVVNNRTDEFGGNIINRAKFILSVVEKIAVEIGKDKVGIRLSPFSTFNDLPAYDAEEVYETYAYLSKQLNALGIAYIHIGINAAITQKTLDVIRENFNGTIILCNGLTPETAEIALTKGFADLVAFGKSYLANPDLDKRIEKDAPLNQPDMKTLYSGSKEGFTDYPTLENE